MCVESYIGIDPGSHGAIARILGDPTNGRIVSSVALPLIPLPGKRVSGMVQFEIPAAYSDLRTLETAYPQARVYIERVCAFPGQGVTSMFAFGMNVGAIQALARAALPSATLVFVTPQVWKKAFNLIKQPKEASIDVAMQELPDAATSIPEDSYRSSYIGCCDALLIAKYAFDRACRVEQMAKGVQS